VVGHKSKLAIAIMFLLVISLISGCFYMPKYTGPQEEDVEKYEEALEELENQLEDLTDEVEEDTEQPVEKVVTTKQVVVEEEHKSSEIDDEVQDILDNNYRYKSIEYDYREGERVDLPTYDVSLKDDAMKIILPEEGGILRTDELDMVILDLDEQTGVGYCASERLCIEQGEFGDVEFEDFYLETPFDWADKIESAEKVGERRLYNRDLAVVHVNDMYEYWIEEYYGIVIKVIELSDDDEVEGETLVIFDNPEYNGLKNADMEYAPIDDI